MNRRVLLASRPVGAVTESNFRIEKSTNGELKARLHLSGTLQIASVARYPRVFASRSAASESAVSPD